MNVYIACHCQATARDVAAYLQAEGFGVTSRWLGQPFGPTASFDDDTRAQFAFENFADIDAADALVLVAGPERYSGGKFMEAGYAYAQRKPVIILGRRENMQCYGPGMRAVGNLLELADTLEAKAKRIQPNSEIPFEAWLYCEVFGWACQNKSHTLTAEIRLRQGFTHYSTASEKPTEKPL